MKPATKEAYQLIHEGTQALSEMEANGIRVDTNYLKREITKLEVSMKNDEEDLRQTKLYKRWEKRYRENTKLGSSDQLAKILFEDMGYEPVEFTEHGKPKTDESALEKIDDPFVKKFVRWKKKGKLKGTYLEGVLREVVDGYAHCVYNLHLVQTYRSSCDSFNFQNQPVRDPEMASIIRPAFLPRSKNRRLVEADFGGIEVCGAACYTHDPVLISYIKDKTKDMHRDMAAQCYMVKPSQVSKQSRYCAKNMFVFPEFYGSYFMQCAPNLWEAIEKYNLEVDGVSLREHLKKQGIKTLGKTKSNYDTGRIESKKGTFIEHIRQVEEDFWGRRFKVYTEWKKDWWDLYCERGWFRTKTGFICQGIYKRNDVLNYPIQGTAFHFLLWCLIQITKRLRKHKMKSCLVGQIHDSILGDVPDKEMQDYCEIVKTVMLEELPKHWKWINVPLTVEIEATQPGCSWHTKEKIAA